MPGMSTRVVAAAAVTVVAAGGVVYALSSGGGDDRKASIGSTTPNIQISLTDGATTRYLSYDVGPSTVVSLKWDPAHPDADAQVLETKASSTTLVEKLATGTAPVTTTANSALTKVTVDSGTKFQTIDGFGGAMTDSSGAMIAKLNSTRKDELMGKLFGSGADGARFSMTRVPLGASDFVVPSDPNGATDTDAKKSATFYNYQPSSTDTFSIAHDKTYLIPLLNQAKSLNSGLKIHAAPWSAPGWMKLGRYKKMWGDCSDETQYPGSGHLDVTNHGTDYAQYLVKALAAYKTEGVAIDVMGLQNEPENCKWNFPTMRMTADEQATLATKVRTELDNSTDATVRATKLLAWDHNYGRTDSNNTWVPTTYPQDAMKCTSTTAKPPLDAVGYHNYDGTDHIEDVQNKFHDDCSGKDIYVTEMTGTAGNPVSADDFRSNMWWRLHHQLFRPLRSWARGSLYWNLAQDANYGPRPADVCTSNCKAMVTVNADGTYTLNENYYYYAQFSKFIQPGATRIASDEPKLAVPNKTAYPLETVAFKNPDGTIVVVAMCQNYA